MDANIKRSNMTLSQSHRCEYKKRWVGESTEGVLIPAVARDVVYQDGVFFLKDDSKTLHTAYTINSNHRMLDPHLQPVAFYT